MGRSEQEVTLRESYMNQLFGLSHPVFQKVEQALREDGKWGINIGPNEARILQTLIQMAQYKKIVEVGTLYAYSTMAMAQALPDAGKVFTLEKSEENAERAQSLIAQSPWQDKIQLLQGDATESLKSIESEGPFDMVFIDANKGGYGAYLEWAIDNVRSGGAIIGDNTFLFGYVYGEGDPNMKVGANPVATMKSFNQILASQFTFSCMLPTDQGMTVAIKS